MAKTFALLVALALALPLSTPIAATAEEPDGSFTAIAAPMPWPLWNDTVGHRCNAGIDGVNKTSQALAPLSDSLLTVSADGLIGDWDLFVEDADGTELGGSNRQQQPTSTSGSEHMTTFVEAGQPVSLIACNQLGAPVAEITYDVESFDVSTIAATIGIGDDGGANNYYEPQEVTISAGQSVAWSVITGTAPHTVTADDYSFEAGTVVGGTYARTFDEPGIYQFFCEFHGLPGQVGQWGRVIVTA